MAFYDQSVTLQLEDDPQHTFVSDARPGQRPYQVSEDRTEPLSADYCPDIVLLGMPFSASEMWQAGDLNSGGILNAADLTLLKRSLLHDDP